MYKTASFVSYVAAFIFLCGCTDVKDRMSQWDQSFLESKNLVSTPLLEDELILGRPFTFQYVDSSLLIYDFLADSLFTLIDLNDNNRIYRFGQKGQGANEFLQPASFGFSSTDSLCTIYDLYKKQLYEVNLTEVKRGIEKYTVLCSDTLGSINLYATRHGSFLGKGFYEHNMFSLTGRDIGRKFFFEYPYRDDREHDIPNHLRGMAYQGSLCFSPSMDRFAFAVMESPILMFFSVNDTSVVKTYEWIGGYPEYRTEVTEKSYSAPVSADNLTSFVGSYATHKYVYLLYSGKTYRESPADVFQSTVIYRLSWDGTPVDKLLLDHPAIMICVSPDDKVLYSLASKGELEIVQYPL